MLDARGRSGCTILPAVQERLCVRARCRRGNHGRRQRLHGRDLCECLLGKRSFTLTAPVNDTLIFSFAVLRDEVGCGNLRAFL